MAHTLTKKQRAYKEAEIINFAMKKMNSPNPSVLCDGCPFVGDSRDPKGSYGAQIPFINPADPSRGLLLDAIRPYWLCPDCTKKKD